MRLNIYKSKCAARELIYKTYAALRTDPQPDTIFMQISKLLFSVFFSQYIFEHKSERTLVVVYESRLPDTRHLESTKIYRGENNFRIDFKVQIE